MMLEYSQANECINSRHTTSTHLVLDLAASVLDSRWHIHIIAVWQGILHRADSILEGACEAIVQCVATWLSCVGLASVGGSLPLLAPAAWVGDALGCIVCCLAGL
jgi:hypothetical protein